MNSIINSKNKTMVFFVLGILLCAAGAVLIAEDCRDSDGATTDSLTYSMTAGVLTISGDGAMKDFTTTNNLISQFPGFTSVVFTGNITSIGNYAFYYAATLESLTITSSITSIGVASFKGCTGLTEITIPNTVTSIGQSAFFHCLAATSITLSSGMTTIPTTAFQECSAFTSITITSSITSIGSGAFMFCSGLTEITIPNTVNSVGIDAFKGCSNLETATLSSGMTAIADSTFQNDVKLTSVEIPDSITSIGASAFSGCTVLSNITISETVTDLGTLAFFGTALTEIYLHYAITIGASATGTATVYYYAIVDFASLSNTITSIHVVVGQEIGTLPEPVRNNYEFGGWYDSDYLYRYYSASTITEDTTLNAYWTPLTIPSYVIIFDAAGGSGAIPYEQISWGDVVIDPKSPTRDGYTFAGWRTVGGDVYDFDTVVTESFTIYAAWTENEPGPAMEPVKVISLLTIILAIVALVLIFVMIRYHFDLYVGLALIADLAVLALNYLYQIV